MLYKFARLILSIFLLQPPTDPLAAILQTWKLHQSTLLLSLFHIHAFLLGLTGSDSQDLPPSACFCDPWILTHCHHPTHRGPRLHHRWEASHHSLRGVFIYFFQLHPPTNPLPSILQPWKLHQSPLLFAPFDIHTFLLGFTGGDSQKLPSSMASQLFTDDADPNSTADTLSQALQTVPRNSAIYVHPKTISFKDGKTRNSWTSLVDLEYRDHIGNFVVAPGKIKIGHFSGPQSNWVGTRLDEDGNPEWDQEPWHCWAAAVIKRSPGEGIYLLIYDNDPMDATKHSRIRDVLRTLQSNLWEALRKRGPVEIIYSVNPDQKGTNRCLATSLRQVRQWAQAGEVLQVPPGDDWLRLTQP